MADIFDGQEALRGGLVKAVVPPEHLLEEALKIARRIATERSAVGVALTRQMMYRNSAQPHPMAAHQVDSLAMFYTSVGDGKEGVQAFLDKRAAQFNSKASEMPSFYPWW
jgi:enoyl-CoA hydratase/carnithine racemase